MSVIPTNLRFTAVRRPLTYHWSYKKTVNVDECPHILGGEYVFKNKSGALN